MSDVILGGHIVSVKEVGNKGREWVLGKKVEDIQYVTDRKDTKWIRVVVEGGFVLVPAGVAILTCEEV